MSTPGQGTLRFARSDEVLCRDVVSLVTVVPTEADQIHWKTFFRAQKSRTIASDKSRLIDDDTTGPLTLTRELSERGQPASKKHSRLLSLALGTGGQGRVGWLPDKGVKNCCICSAAFTLVHRRHHCRSCGRVVCGPCSDYKLDIAGHSKPKRVCIDCYGVNDATLRSGMTAARRNGVKPLLSVSKDLLDEVENSSADTSHRGSVGPADNATKLVDGDEGPAIGALAKRRFTVREAIALERDPAVSVDNDGTVRLVC